MAALTKFEEYMLRQFRSILNPTLMPARASERSKALALELRTSIEADFAPPPEPPTVEEPAP